MNIFNAVVNVNVIVMYTNYNQKRVSGKHYANATLFFPQKNEQIALFLSLYVSSLTMVIISLIKKEYKYQAISQAVD